MKSIELETETRFLKEYLSAGVGPGELGGVTDDGESGNFLGGGDNRRHC